MTNLPAIAELIRYTNRLAALQHDDGHIPERHRRVAGALLDQIASVAAPHNRCLAAAFVADAKAWRRDEFATPPRFDRARDALHSPENDAAFLFVGPVEVPNATVRGRSSFQAFLALRDEPEAVRAVRTRLPHPGAGCQCTRLLAASDGYLRGNCLVFFPENVSAAAPAALQNYALFLLNKFEPIYRLRTLPNVRKALAGRTLFGGGKLKSAGLSPERTYEARCVWAYLHDCFHYIGPRPFVRNIALKTRFFTGAIEELRVDARGILHLWETRHRDAGVVTEMVLFERMLRYPCHPRALANFDAASGFFLFSWLKGAGALRLTGAATVSIDADQTLVALQALVTAIEDAERLDDVAYIGAVENLVRRHLPETAKPDRFAVPASYQGLATLLPTDRPIDFRKCRLW